MKGLAAALLVDLANALSLLRYLLLLGSEAAAQQTQIPSQSAAASDIEEKPELFQAHTTTSKSLKGLFKNVRSQ